jgi:hypothetical protein
MWIEEKALFLQLIFTHHVLQQLLQHIIFIKKSTAAPSYNNLNELQQPSSVPPLHNSLIDLIDFDSEFHANQQSMAINRSTEAEALATQLTVCPNYNLQGEILREEEVLHQPNSEGSEDDLRDADVSINFTSDAANNSDIFVMFGSTGKELDVDCFKEAHMNMST